MCASVCWERVKDYSNPTIVRMGFPDNSFRSRLRTRNVRILHIILIVDQSLRRERNRSGSSLRISNLRISALSRSHRYCVVFSLRLYARMWTGFLLPLRFRPSPSITSPHFPFLPRFLYDLINHCFRFFRVNTTMSEIRICNDAEREMCEINASRIFTYLSLHSWKRSNLYCTF